MINEHYAELIARHLAGESSEEEKKELEIFLKEDAHADYFYELLSGYWVKPKNEVNELQQEIHFQQIIAIAEKDKSETIVSPDEIQSQPISRKNIFSLKTFLAAAVIAGIIISSYFLFFQKTTTSVAPIARNIVEANRGTRSNILLPDGSKVWLNSDSKLEYIGDFNQNIREVTLVGEAYFEVARDPAHPFVVHTSDIDIRVLGTAFNVKSYPQDEIIETTLIHGLIEVTNIKQGSKMTLHPHDKLIFHKHDNHANTTGEAVSENNIISIAPISLKISDSERVETSWIYNKLVFDGETFREAAAKMERWYNVKINFNSEKVANFQLHYTIGPETIEQALKFMKESGFKFNYEIHGNEIEIY